MIQVISKHLGVPLGTVHGKLHPAAKAGDMHEVHLQAVVKVNEPAQPTGRMPMQVVKHKGALALNGDTVALQLLLLARGWEDAE